MLSKFEWYRRWRGGWYDLNKSDLSFDHRWFCTPSVKHIALWNRTHDDYTVHYPGRGAKPRMRVYATFAPMSIKTYGRVMAIKSLRSVPVSNNLNYAHRLWHGQ